MRQPSQASRTQTEPADRETADRADHEVAAADGTMQRRTVLRAVGVVGVAGLAGATTASCSSGSSGYSSAPSNAAPPSATPSAPDTGASQPPTSAAAGGGMGGTALGAASQVPLGGGKIFADQQVVVTQPEHGTYRAFGTTCTHMGCQVNQVSHGLIECPCHGSRYSIADGSVKAGPAPAPLPPKQITVTGGQINLST